MADINKFIGDVSEYSETAEHMLDLEPWDENRAVELAKQEGIELTDAHWKVVLFVRKHYIDNGPVDNARKMTELLEERFGDDGGRKYLYQLFPNGPVSQASRIAGLPLPHDSADPSFGSVQ
jgi:TusE/DsrC/DsvC family sulfur relay protein